MALHGDISRLDILEEVYNQRDGGIWIAVSYWTRVQ
jgi:hypothetical protein